MKSRDFKRENITKSFRVIVSSRNLGHQAPWGVTLGAIKQWVLLRGG